MSHWPYIAAAYALTIGGMGGLSLVAWLKMRKAEESSNAISRSSRERKIVREPQQ